MKLQGISPCTFSKLVGSIKLTMETLEGGKRFEIKSLQRQDQRALLQAIAKDEQKGLGTIHVRIHEQLGQLHDKKQ